MRAVLPGKPEAKLQALSTVQWRGRRLVVYISGCALVVLGGPHHILQTIYHDEGELLDAVLVDESSGKIALCCGKRGYIYRPFGLEEDALRWSLQTSFEIDTASTSNLCLSWGTSEELLVSSDFLRLYATNGSLEIIWTKQLANAVKLAQFSCDATFIATIGHYGRQVKIWRRLSFGSDAVRFNFTYLPHPAIVTAINWRKSHKRGQRVEQVLYTVAADDVLRIWSATDPHGLQDLQLWGQVDLQESIKPRGFTAEPSTARYVFVIDSRDLMMATERVLQSGNGGDPDAEHQARDHLIEIARRSPEVCVILDSEGRMSAWGFGNIGRKNRSNTDIFNVAHIEGLRLELDTATCTEERHVQFHNFCDDAPGDEFTLLVHRFNGSIEWLEGRVDSLFDPSPQSTRMTTKALWAGHARSIKKMNRTAGGNALVSRTSADESVLWKQGTSETAGLALFKQCDIRAAEIIRKTCLLKDGDFVLALHEKTVSLWDTRSKTAIQIGTCGFEISGRPLCLMALPRSDALSEIVFVATVTSDGKGLVWRLRLPSQPRTTWANGALSETHAMSEFSAFDLNAKHELAFIVPVDPAGSTPIVSGFVDVFARDVAISVTKDGVISTWTANVDELRSEIRWLATSTIETAIDRPRLASGSSIRKAAVVDREGTGLTIWDTRGALLEYEHRFEAADIVRDLDWTATPGDQSILAVGFPHRVLLMCQMRYDYLGFGSAWATVREIRIREMTPHPIGDSTWLSSGHLVIGAGNQMFIYDRTIDFTDDVIADLRLPTRRDLSDDLFEVTSRVNGPLPVFHPQFLMQCILRGRSDLVRTILLKLLRVLKFFSPGDPLDSFLSLPVEMFYNKEQSVPAGREMHTSYGDFSDDEERTLTEKTAAKLNDLLSQTRVPRLSGQEQLHLANIIDSCAMVEKHRRSMDDNASRYMLFFRRHILRSGQSGLAHVRISWREITWAFHSNNQEILVDLVSRQFQGRMMWKHARESGMFMWLQDSTALKTQFESIARNHYTSTEEKNPIDCSLYYLALRKKSILVGLWRMANGNIEQRSTQKLLANNFQEARWKTAALKNAYALLGRHRFEYAAAFFLLADCLKDAVNVCLNQLDDLQLAIAIARVYAGDDSIEVKELLEDVVLPQAARDGNRWLATWAFWMLNRRDKAVRALISPIHSLLTVPASPNLQAKSFLTSDPALVIFYQQLREKTLQTLKGASRVSPRAEWEFIVRHAQLYDRMGCDLLALDLVRNWEFLQAMPEKEKSSDEEVVDPRKMLRRRSSMVVADLPLSPTKIPIEMRSGGDSTKKEPTMFEEPDMSNLLDSFGF